MKHTKEPWCTNGREIGDKPMMYTKISNSISGNSYEEAKANAERIVACVNACAGIDNPESFMEVVKKLELDAYEKVKSQRDELLNFIHDFKSDYERNEKGEPSSPEEMYKQACDLITKYQPT